MIIVLPNTPEWLTKLNIFVQFTELSSKMHKIIFIIDRGCPKCNKSHGEKFIENFLNKRNLEYVSQYPINIDKTINSSGKAHIDFYIPSLNLAIEYNGIQHYKPVERFGGET